MPDGQVTRATRTRESLLRTASEILESDGLEAVTLRALGAAAGVSRGAPYRHFSDKDALLAAVAAEAMRQLRQSMLTATERATADDPLDRLAGMLEAYVETAATRPEHYRLIFGTDLTRGRHPDLVAEAQTTYRLLAAAVRDAQAAGALPGSPSPTDLSAVLLSVTHGLADLVITGHATPAKGFADRGALLRLLLTTMRTD